MTTVVSYRDTILLSNLTASTPFTYSTVRILEAQKRTHSHRRGRPHDKVRLGDQRRVSDGTGSHVLDEHNTDSAAAIIDICISTRYAMYPRMYHTWSTSTLGSANENILCISTR
jgi:hypothetical protein